MASRKFADFETINRLVKLRIKIVNPQLIEITENNVRRAMRDEIQPVIECLLVVLRELCPARFHFDEDAARPYKVRVLGAVAGKTDAILKSAILRKRVGVVAEGFEQMQKKRLRIAFLVAFEFGSVFREVVKSSFL